MTRPSPNSRQYGYFTWLGYEWEQNPKTAVSEVSQSEAYAGDDIFMFLGRGGQRVFVSRLYDLVVVRLGPANGMNPLKGGWDNAYLVNTVIRGIKTEQCLLGFC
jgi:hypothetical protein